MERADSRRERSVEMRDLDDFASRERWEGGYDDADENGMEKSRESSKHRSKDRSKSSRKEEKDHRGRDRDRPRAGEVSKEREKEAKELERDPLSSRVRRKEDRDEHEKDRVRDKVGEKDADREKYRDKEREREKDRAKEKEHEKERDSEKDIERGRGKDRVKEKIRDRDKERDRAKDKEREKHKDRENDRGRDKDMFEKIKVRDRTREKERENIQDKDRSTEKENVNQKQRDEGHDRSKDRKKIDRLKLGGESDLDNEMTEPEGFSHHDEDNNKAIKHETSVQGKTGELQPSSVQLEERILMMKEERLKKPSKDAFDIVLWVNKSRKLEEKRNAGREKALQLSKIFEEQDNINQENSADEEAAQPMTHDLSGVKVLHGLDKVIEGGAVVLTLKDQSVLVDGDINQEVDMLENVEIGEQKRRDDAYKAAKKKTGLYDDKFNDELGSERKILPQYDDPVVDEGLTLDAKGHFSGEAEKKLAELRRRIDGVSADPHFEDLNSSGKISSDYYTHEEMFLSKKPKKKKSIRKKEKLDIDALEAEARSAGLGVGDLGSRKDSNRKAYKEELERSEAEMRNNAYQSAYAKADEASKALRVEQTRTIQAEDDDNLAFNDDDEDLRKSLERAKRLSLKKQEDEAAASGLHAIAAVASSSVNNSAMNSQNPASGESQENKVVFTEMEEFVWGLQLDKDSQKPDEDDVFMEEDMEAKVSDQEMKDVDGGWTEVDESGKEEISANEEIEKIVPDDTIHEVAVGKGLSGALKLLKDRGTLKESVEWGGRNMDKKKSKLVGLYNNEGQKEIRIERTDEYGRILTPKEAFRLLSHKFHGKGPGKMKQEKRMRQYLEDLKVKQMKNADTPSLSVERMKEAQAKLQTPYLVLSGHVKPGQTSDPRSGFATVEKDLPGGLTPMLGDRKVEHFLGIKRKSEHGDGASPKKRKD